jgi:hypothetical protein
MCSLTTKQLFGDCCNGSTDQMECSGICRRQKVSGGKTLGPTDRQKKLNVLTIFFKNDILLKDKSLQRMLTDGDDDQSKNLFNKNS